MWIAASITTTQVWDACLWHAAATWEDDETGERTTLVQSGQSPLHGAEGPQVMLAAALRGLEEAAVTACRPVRDVSAAT